MVCARRRFIIWIAAILFYLTAFSLFGGMIRMVIPKGIDFIGIIIFLIVSILSFYIWLRYIAKRSPALCFDFERDMVMVGKKRFSVKEIKEIRLLEVAPYSFFPAVKRPQLMMKFKDGSIKNFDYFMYNRLTEILGYLFERSSFPALPYNPGGSINGNTANLQPKNYTCKIFTYFLILFELLLISIFIVWGIKERSFWIFSMAIVVIAIIFRYGPFYIRATGDNMVFRHMIFPFHRRIYKKTDLREWLFYMPSPWIWQIRFITHDFHHKCFNVVPLSVRSFNELKENLEQNAVNVRVRAL